MKFSDLFVPKYMNSQASVRKKAVGRIKDVKLLQQMAQKDSDESVREAASRRASQLRQQSV